MGMPGIKFYEGVVKSGKTARIMSEMMEGGRSIAFRVLGNGREPYAGRALVTHGGDYMFSEPVEPNRNGVNKIVETVLGSDFDIVGVDEVQFLPSEGASALETLRDNGYEVVAAGLPTDYRGESFGTSDELRKAADEVEVLNAECIRCGEEADLSRKVIVDEEEWYEPQNDYGADEIYEPVCGPCHEIPVEA